MLKESYEMFLKLVMYHTDEELFVKWVYKWAKSTTLGTYFVRSTSSHYGWAMKKIRKYIKA